MKKSATPAVGFVLLAALLSGCAPAATLMPPATASPAATLAPSNTPKPPSNPTPVPTQTESITRTPSGPFPVGTYKGEHSLGYSFIFTFLPDGTYATNIDGISSSGTYVVADNQIAFTELSPPVCGQSTYTWSFDGTTLMLVRVQDPCGYHSGAWDETVWIKQP